MAYLSEFEVESIKYVFRFEDINLEEAELWKKHMVDEVGAQIDDYRELFEPFEGERNTFLNEDVGTDELRISRYTWTDPKTSKIYKLLDMNSWPGDNECGFIAFNGIKTITNSDQSLEFC